MPTKFIIYGQSRSGSTLLVELIGANPPTHCDGELFGRGSMADITNPLRRYIYTSLPVLYMYQRQHLFKDQVYGFKLLFYQIRYTRYWLRLLHALGWKLIHLRRRNTRSSGAFHHHRA